MDKRPIGIDLFSGAGGMSLGFEQAGFDIVAAVEIDPIHCLVHEYNFPRTKTICSSVTELTGEKIRKIAGLGNSEVDVVFGGAPCQGFSMIGKRALDDPRNQLVSHFVRIVSEIKPKFCVFENVKGLTLGKHKKFLDELIEELEKSGYATISPYEVLNAKDYGVPQDRKRLFIVGHRKDTAKPSYPEKLGNAPTVNDALDGIPDAEAFDELKTQPHVILAEPLRAKSDYARTLCGAKEDDEDFSYRRTHDPKELTCSLLTEHGDESRKRFLETEAGKTEPISRFHKLDKNGVCNTLRAGTDSSKGAFTSPRPIHPEFPRCITVREAARLHSYPDWFMFHDTKWHGMREIGNSVPPLLARNVAKSIINAMGIKPSKPEDILDRGDRKVLSFDMTKAARRFGVDEKTIKGRTRES